MTNDDDLRTALTKLAAPMYYDAAPGAYPVTAVPMSHLLSVLAVHPAPAPVSDTRREDVARAIERAIRQSFQSDDHAHTYRRAADGVLAVLPAPPVVDEAEVRDLILKVDDEGGWSNIFPDEATALAAEIAARLRGESRG